MCKNINEQERNRQETQDLRWFGNIPISIHYIPINYILHLLDYLNT
jgi:hypothetical protein